MNKYLKFFLGFIFLIVLVDLMLIDRKKRSAGYDGFISNF